MATSITKNNSTPTFITEVEIELLFNLYSYTLKIDTNAGVDLPRLFILYGDNGSGKTTLLKLIFNLLAPVLQRGHRTFLAQTPFRRLAVKLGADIGIIAQKVGNNLLGSYRATITRKGRKIFDEVIVAAGKNHGVKRDDPGAVHFTEALAKLNITLYFLADDRKTQSTFILPDEDQRLTLFQDDDVYITSEGRLQLKESPESGEQNLESAINNLERWIRSEALKGSSEGEASTNTIYTDIVKRIARAKGRAKEGSSRNVEELQKSLAELDTRSRAFTEYGLITPLQVSGLISTLESSTGAKRLIIANVLTPYIDGLRARLDALQEVQKLIRIFVESVNSFFHNKEISFYLPRGVQITSSRDEKLSPQMLSSGERQLLLLFCNTITARSQNSIFIIDEPELSLNIKWQRNLLSVLLSCTKDSAVQFIIATHSVELLTRHRAHVLRLFDDRA